LEVINSQPAQNRAERVDKMKHEDASKLIDRAFDGVNCPDTHKNAIKRIYNVYPAECMPQGICDPVYILNVLCKELGIGDGQSHFYKYTVHA
jgi:hypothetical protein